MFRSLCFFVFTHTFFNNAMMAPNGTFMAFRFDWRLSFVNLKTDGARKNIIKEEERDKIWIPQLVFDNAVKEIQVFFFSEFVFWPRYQEICCTFGCLIIKRLSCSWWLSVISLQFQHSFGMKKTVLKYERRFARPQKNMLIL